MTDLHLLSILVCILLAHVIGSTVEITTLQSDEDFGTRTCLVTAVSKSIIRGHLDGMGLSAIMSLYIQKFKNRNSRKLVAIFVHLPKWVLLLDILHSSSCDI